MALNAHVLHTISSIIPFIKRSFTHVVSNVTQKAKHRRGWKNNSGTDPALAPTASWRHKNASSTAEAQNKGKSQRRSQREESVRRPAWPGMSWGTSGFGSGLEAGGEEERPLLDEKGVPSAQEPGPGSARSWEGAIALWQDHRRYNARGPGTRAAPARRLEDRTGQQGWDSAGAWELLKEA